MTDTPPTRPPLPAYLRRKHRLLTCVEVLSALRLERIEEGLTATAKKYSIKPQQLCDVLAGRSRLSKRMAARLTLKIWTFYERVGE